MKIIGILLFFSTSVFCQIKQHPQNHHYFIYKDQPTILVASGEHYGAVINEDFNYEKYLRTLNQIGLNHTRIFLGDYVEEENAFCIEENTLSPNPNKFITPWKRSNTPGYVLGDNKFDLNEWNEDYFERLHDFMRIADENDIIVEAVLFFSGYLYKNSPFNILNNINGTDSISGQQYLTLKNGNILDFQREYVDKIILELNKYDNLIINIANEPWFDNQEDPGFASTPPLPTKKWIKTVSDWIVNSEREKSKQHLISIDYTNEGKRIPATDLNNYYKNISVFNHHYDKNAKSASLNYGKMNRILSFNETGLMPAATPEYRIQAWKYLFSGGALYNNLDFTYQVGFEDGSGSTEFICEWYSACTDPKVKYELANLLKFMNSIDFINMRPDYNSVALRYGDENIHPFISKGNQYAVYFEGGNKPKIKLIIPAGKWNIKWINPSDLDIIKEEELLIEINRMDLIGPDYTEDILLFIENN